MIKCSGARAMLRCRESPVHQYPNFQVFRICQEGQYMNLRHGLWIPKATPSWKTICVFLQSVGCFAQIPTFKSIKKLRSVFCPKSLAHFAYSQGSTYRPPRGSLSLHNAAAIAPLDFAHPQLGKGHGPMEGSDFPVMEIGHTSLSSTSFFWVNYNNSLI